MTSLLPIEPGRFDGMYAPKAVAGGIAVLCNAMCLVPVLKRRASADTGDLADVFQKSEMIDPISSFCHPDWAGCISLWMPI